MNRIKPHSLGLSFGVFLGLWHTMWSLLVFFGAAQWLIDLVFRLHMITPPYKISAFSLGAAACLVIFTTCFGYVIGLLIGIIWNSFALRSGTN
jgi:hypothetical protein